MSHWSVLTLTPRRFFSPLLVPTIRMQFSFEAFFGAADFELFLSPPALLKGVYLTASRENSLIHRRRIGSLTVMQPDGSAIAGTSKQSDYLDLQEDPEAAMNKSVLMSAKVDYYEVLGIPQDSTYEEIKKSYHNLVRKCHPDKTDSEIQYTLDKFLLIEEAWKVLGDQQARTLYDAKRILENSSYRKPVDEELSFKDLVKDPEKGVFKKQCRCGGWFCVSFDDAAQGGLVAVECDNCSLSLVVDCDI